MAVADGAGVGAGVASAAWAGAAMRAVPVARAAAALAATSRFLIMGVLLALVGTWWGCMCRLSPADNKKVRSHAPVGPPRGEVVALSSDERKRMVTVMGNLDKWPSGRILRP